MARSPGAESRVTAAEVEATPAPPPLERSWVRAASVTALYGVVVIVGAVHHEPWRDEVVPLSIARHAGSLTELAAPLRFEGHPILWYLLLWVGWSVVGETWVLKAASLAAAIGAVWLVNRSRLPWWLAGLFTFSLFPLYQYSVVSRGYSLEMLVLFACCALVPHRRAHPLALGLGLAALANCEAFGAAMAIAAAMMLAVDAWMTAARPRRFHFDPWVAAAAVVLVAGLVLAAEVALPDVGHRGTPLHRHGLAAIADGVGRAIAWPVAHATRLALVPWPSLWVWAYFAYLIETPPLLCFTALALVGMELLFNLAHGADAVWLIGNALLVVVASLWLAAAGTLATVTLPAAVARARTWLGRGLLAGFTLMLGSHVYSAVDHVQADLRHDYSANRALAARLDQDPTLANAVVMGEPDVLTWSVPYYSRRRLFLPREDTFRDWGIFAPPRRFDYDLGSLLDAARRVQADCACPVVIAMGWDLDRPGVRTNFAGTPFAETFIVTAAELEAFRGATQLLAPRGSTMTDEWYHVYVLR